MQENEPKGSTYQLYSKYFDAEGSKGKKWTTVRKCNTTSHLTQGVVLQTRKCVLASSLGLCRRAKIPTEVLPYRSGSNTEAFEADPLETSKFPFHYKSTWEIKPSLLALLWYL